MNRNGESQESDFEDCWKQRFKEFARYREDDAGISGWSPTGLDARFRFFSRHWPKASPGGRWLDVGCGPGTYARFLAERGMEVVGLDYSLPSLQKAQNRSSPKLGWVVADARRLPIEEEAADGVLCFGVTQSLRESESLMEELSRVTARKGMVWVDGLNGWCLPHLMTRVWRWARREPAHLRYETPWDLKRAVRRAGFGQVRLLWLPVLPARLQRFQKWLEFQWLVRLLHAIPPLGMVMSHSMVIWAKR